MVVVQLLHIMVMHMNLMDSGIDASADVINFLLCCQQCSS